MFKYYDDDPTVIAADDLYLLVLMPLYSAVPHCARVVLCEQQRKAEVIICDF